MVKNKKVLEDGEGAQESLLPGPSPLSTTPSIHMSEKDISAEYGVSFAFINQHSRAMKPYKWRPRRFFRKFVEEFFLKRALDVQYPAESNRLTREDPRDAVMRDLAEIKERIAWRKKHGLRVGRSGR